MMWEENKIDIIEELEKFRELLIKDIFGCKHGLLLYIDGKVKCGHCNKKNDFEYICCKALEKIKCTIGNETGRSVDYLKLYVSGISAHIFPVYK